MNGAALREVVRKATDGRHRAVEAHPITVRALSPPFTADAMRAFLEGMRPAWRTIEAERERADVGAALAGAIGPPRAADLDLDIARLGGISFDTRPAGVAAPTCELPTALGGLYVLEGARQGAAVVRRALADDPLLGDLRFFRVDRSAPTLAQFIEGVAAALATDGERAQFLAGADGAFAAILAGLDRAAAR